MLARLILRCIRAPGLMLLFAASTVASASSGLEDSVAFQSGEKIFVRFNKGQHEIGVLRDGNRYTLVTPERILSISEFANSEKQVAQPWRYFKVRDGFAAATPSAWFFAMTDKGLVLVRRTRLEESRFVATLLPIRSVNLSDFSTSSAGFGDKILFLASFRNETGEKGTYAVRLFSSPEAGQLSNYQVIPISQDFTELERDGKKQFEYDVIKDQLSISGRVYRLASIAHVHQSQTAKMVLSEAAAEPSQFERAGQRLKSVVETMRTQAAKQIAPPSVSAAPAASTPNLSAGAPSAETRLADQPHAWRVAASAEAASNSVSSAQLNGLSREVEFAGEKFTIYNAQQALDSGVYIQRASDKVIVKIAPKMVVLGSNSSAEGFTVQDGILSHPELPRQIDLQKSENKDAFLIESRFRPSKISPELQNWIDVEATNLRADGRARIPVIDERKPFVRDLIRSVTKDGRSSLLVVGESGDKIQMAQEVIDALPRTWRALELETGLFGDIGIVGSFEKKMKHLADVVRTVPILWVAENFENLKGFGAMDAKGKDIVDLLARDLSDRSGYLRVLATSNSTEDFMGRITNPLVQQSLPIKAVEPLSAKQVETYLQNFLQSRYESIKAPSDFLQALHDLADDFRVTDPEPQRSLDLLEAHIARLEEAGQLESSRFNRAELNITAQNHYQLDPALRDRKKQKQKLVNYLDVLNENIVGHEHLKAMMRQATQIGMSGLSSGRGPRESYLIDGPPGVGKTELVMAHGKALGVPVVRIEMNQFKHGSGKTIDDLLKQIHKATKRNAFVVILLDEVEKAAADVLEGLLAAMDAPRYTFYEEVGGTKRAMSGSLKNATVFATSNLIGEKILQWFGGLSDEEKELKSTELEKRFSERFTADQLEEFAVERGFPRPLYDRFQVKSFAFPPSRAAMQTLLRMKMRGAQKLAEARLRSRVLIINEKAYLDQLVDRARNEGLSSRSIIKIIETHTKGLASEIGFLDHFAEGRTYVIDLSRGELVPADGRLRARNGSVGGGTQGTPAASSSAVRCELLFN